MSTRPALEPRFTRTFPQYCLYDAHTLNTRRESSAERETLTATSHRECAGTLRSVHVPRGPLELTSWGGTCPACI
jgi:hypothetical protein